MIALEALAKRLESVEDGHEDALVVFAELSNAEKIIKQAKEQIKEQALEEAKDYDKTFQLKGHTFEFRNGGRMYDYKHISKWVELTNSRKELEELSKQALKQEIYDSEGVQVEPPIVTYRSDSLIVK